ncbi:MAG: hypothetical protein JRH20_11190 [Deltaproteobacteria bacterium]|nr:hypothetical protein [Deltaproteobacteria bacterium]
MTYLLDVEFIEGGSEARLTLYRHSLLRDAHAESTPLMLRAVGSGWDHAAEAPTQFTDLGEPIAFTITEVSSARLRLSIKEWPEEAPLGELMQFSVGDGSGELYLWARALGFNRCMGTTKVPLDAQG